MPLPLILALHPFGADHQRVLTGMSLPQALALRVGGRPLPPMAMAAADGGPGYWNRHPGDDPMAMVIDELACRLASGTGWGTGGGRSARSASRWAGMGRSCWPRSTRG